jgi:hypothetical protein
MKTTTFISITLIVSSSVLFANNCAYNTLPPPTDKLIKNEEATKGINNQAKKLFLTKNFKNYLHTKNNYNYTKKAKEELQIAAIREYANLMPEIIGKE